MTINFETAVITGILDNTANATELEIDIDGRAAKALSYDLLTGPTAVGDRIIVNMTAVDLFLGTGGYGFVLWNLSNTAFSRTGSGHLMKLRYTPLQVAALSVEEQDSPYHEILKDKTAIGGMPVIACELHSQLLPIVATLKDFKPEIKIAYIMTDGGALPAVFSKTVVWLKQNDYLKAVITSGQAFGGDFEAVNIYSALTAAKYVVEADVAVVAMGPGIVGTGTALGHTGIEQGQIINAAASLAGLPIAVLRLSRADRRDRHFGLSHHTITSLTVAALAPALIPVPELTGDLADLGRSINEQIKSCGIAERHQIHVVKNEITLPALEAIAKRGGPKASTMSRGPAREPAFFLAAGAAALLEIRPKSSSAGVN